MLSQCFPQVRGGGGVLENYSLSSLVLSPAFLPACFYICLPTSPLAGSLTASCWMLSSFSTLQCLTNLSISLPDPVFLLEQHWLKPKNIVNNVFMYMQVATLVLNNYLAGRLHDDG